MKRRLAAALVWSLLGPVCLGGAAPGPQDRQYTLRGWQVEDGLPQNSVTAIVQTRDGFLWVATYGGLARFDGETFQNFSAPGTPGLQDNDIVSLYEDPKGALWIGHQSGSVTVLRDGRFESAPDGANASSLKAVAISADSSGTIWTLRGDGSLQSESDGRVLPRREGHPPGALALVRDAAGELYVDRDGQVARLHAGALEPVNFGPARWSDYVLGIAPSSDGGLWIVRDKRVQKWKDGRWTEDRAPPPLGDSSVSAMTELSDGSVAVGTNEMGFYLLRPGGGIDHFDQGNGLPQNWVRALREDQEGDLWVGVGTGGLVMAKPALFSVTNAPDRWQGHTVLSVASGGGGLWIGTEGGGLYRYVGGRWSHFGQEQGLPNPYIWSVAEDADGRVWVGTWGGGLYCLMGGRCRPAAGIATGGAPVLALLCTPEDGGLWAGVGNGLVHLRNGTAEWAFRAQPGATNNVSTIVRDRSGVLWFGITGGGLGRIANGKITVFRRTDGLASDRVNCLLPEDDGTLWIGTADAGLSRYKHGRFSTIGESQGLPSSVVCSIEEDGSGGFWLSTHRGILRYPKSALDRCADGQTPTVAGQFYGRDDGLPTLEFSGGLKAAGCRTADGRLWFTSSKGLVSVDPAQVRSNLVPPPVTLESLDVDGRRIYNEGGAIDGLMLAPDHLRLEFRFAALSFTSPGKVKFKYRLLGLDRDWVDSGNKRSASYSQLPPGSYQFECIACNDYGVWNTRGAGLAFTVMPFFWQTWWFLTLCGFAVFLFGAWAVRFEIHRRMQRQVAHLEQERAIERERTRIARDIHDDIGASLTRITLLSQWIPGGPGQESGATAVLQEISGTAREVTQSLDEIVWAVNPKHDTLESLVCYMAKFFQDFLGAAHVRCRLDLPAVVPDWSLSTHIRHNLFLAFKEVLNNAVKHSEASEVWLSLRIDPAAFVFAIGDNGRGMPTPCGPEGANGRNGMSNLQHRLAQIGGRCEIVTRSGAGTTVTFVIGRPRSARRNSAKFPRNIAPGHEEHESFC